MTGASARWSRLHVPVETGTPPYIVGAKSAPLCFRLSAKAPLRSLAPPLPRKAAARPFLGSRGSVRKVRPALLPPVGESAAALPCSSSSSKSRCAAFSRIAWVCSQSPPRSAFACRRKRRCAPLLLLFLEKPLCGLFSDRVGLFAKSAPLCFRLSAKAPLRSLAPPLPRKAAARPFLGSRGSVRKVRPALLPPVGESAAVLPCSSSSSKSRYAAFSRIAWVCSQSPPRSASACRRKQKNAAARPPRGLPGPLCKTRPPCFRPPAEARCGWYTVIIPRPAGEVYYNFVKFTSR